MDLYAIDGVVPAELLERRVDRIRRDPSHPGRLLAADCESKSLNVPAAAKQIGVSSTDLTRVIDGQGPVTPELAVKLEAASWPSAEFWMRLQSKWDLAQARRTRQDAA